MRIVLLGLLGLVLSTSARAALPVGAKAPEFATTGALAGKPFQFRLSKELRKGPLILYFYPKAFTKGCTLEAHAFSEAAPEFKRSGVRVVGLSADDLPTLKRFSVEECRNAFPVATATPSVIRAYKVAMPVVNMVKPMTNRTSYLIDRDGRIVAVHSEMDWSKHVSEMLAAARKLTHK